MESNGKPFEMSSWGTYFRYSCAFVFLLFLNENIEKEICVHPLSCVK